MQQYARNFVRNFGADIMARKAKLDPPVEFRCHIPTSLDIEVKKRLWDPVLRKQKYGAASELMIRLLADWIKTTEVNPIAEDFFKQEDADAASSL
jgi:hypothetical protein